MDVGLYIAAQGMLTDQVRQDQLSNDLANASTPGYKSDHAGQSAFGQVLLANTATGSPIGPLDRGVAVDRIVTALSPGTLHETGQPLDFGVDGAGFFAVNTAQGVRYTRDGQFSASAQGLLVDGQGNQVLSQSGAPIRVGADGKVPAAALGVFSVAGAAKQGDNLYTGTGGGRATGTVKQGSLEASQVDPVQTMVDMIASLRAYESGQKAINSIDETLGESAGSVGSLGG
jgi:flagellar basal-body rod protein FlgG